MPFCPKCRAEYRQGFEICPSCDDEPLVVELIETADLTAEEMADTLPVGMSSTSDDGHIVQLDGRSVDLLRVFVLSAASELEKTLIKNGVVAMIVPLPEIEFPDMQPRFEVRVRSAVRDNAEAMLRELWRDRVEAEGVASNEAQSDIEACPACGAHVALDVEECPDCGLVIGPS